MAEGVNLIKEDLIAVGFDDTLIKKTGKRIKGASWQRDSLSPPFCVNFTWGIRYLQASLLLPLYKMKKAKPCRGIPVQFTQLPKFKKPSRFASQEKWDAYQKLIRQFNLSTTFVKQLRYLRNELNGLGLQTKKLLAVVDGSFINRTCLSIEMSNTYIIGRMRKNARLFFRSKQRGRRFYDPQSYTAEELRKKHQDFFRSIKVYYAGGWRTAKYLEFSEVFWKWGTKRKPLRLIILAPTPYRRTKNSRREYRDPAYLITTDFELPASTLIQKYLDRWQIEVNFKEEKSQMSLGKQQVWSEKSIPRLPAFIVACYAALMLAGVLHFQDSRDHPIFTKLPKWRQKPSIRPSFMDLMTVLRIEVAEKFELSLNEERFKYKKDDLITKAAA